MDPGGGEGNQTPIPSRPKGMWNRTYKPLIDEIVSLEAKGNGDFLDYVRQKHPGLDL